MRMILLAAACTVALAAALPAGAKTPPPGVVASVGIEVAKLGLKASDIDTATSKCATASCLSKSYTAFFMQAHVVDNALKALWMATGRSGQCASAAVNAAAGFDSLTGNYHSLEVATLKNDNAAAKAAYSQIRAKTPRVTAILNSFKTKCR